MDQDRVHELISYIDKLHDEIWKWWPEYAKLREIKYYDEIDEIVDITRERIELTGYEPNGGDKMNFMMPTAFIYSEAFRDKFKADALEAKKKREAEHKLSEARRNSLKKINLSKEIISKLYDKAKKAESIDELYKVEQNFNFITANLMVEDGKDDQI